MPSCTLYFDEAPERPVRLVFSDFNRLRWAVDALRVHQSLRHSLLVSAENLLLMDSVILHEAEGQHARQPTHVVLWDGLNSLIELRQRRNDLHPSAEPQMLFVGQFPEAEACMPVGAWPLYPRGVNESWTWPERAAGVRVPKGVSLHAWSRRQLRPFVQSIRQREVHRRMAAGGYLVFCGAVRHNSMLLSDSFRGAHALLATLRTELEDLSDLPWDTEPQRAQARIARAVAQLQHSARGLCVLPAPMPVEHAAAWAGLFNVLNLLHRQFVLSLLNQRTDQLTVIEFGRQRHFDPYDAAAYRDNLFLDFGSTCGSELLYPRRLDIARNGKQLVSLRLLKPEQTLAAWFREQGAEGFLRQANADADRVMQAFAAFTASARKA